MQLKEYPNVCVYVFAFSVHRLRYCVSVYVFVCVSMSIFHLSCRRVPKKHFVVVLAVSYGILAHGNDPWLLQAQHI